MYTARTIYLFIRFILPSLLLAHEDGLRLPDDIISSEYITLEGRKISTSQNSAVWAKDLTEEYNPDSIRYFFIANGPIAILLHPFLPFSSTKVSEWLGVEIKWKEQDIGVKVIPKDISILFSKID